MPFWLATFAVRVPSPTASAAQSDLVAAFRRRIAEVNDLSALGGEALVPLVVDGARVGELRASLASELGERWPDVFRRDPDRDVLALAPTLSDADARTAAVAGVTAALRDDGTFSKGWRDELCAVGAAFDAPPAFSIERACYPAFGVKGYGIHVNAFCVDPATGERQLWVATRSRQKSTWPGMLDNLVAGQQPAELSLYQNVVKEAGEEAGIPEEIARRAKSVGVCSYRGVDEWGQLKNDVLFCYDLELPWDFEPVAVDGEVEGFERWDLDRVAAAVATGANNAIGEFTSYKPNCNLVVIDFLVRIGWLSADAPGYLQLVDELRQGDCR